MDIEDVRKAKSECQIKIIDALDDFQKQTGMCLDRVEIELIDVSTVGATRKMLGNVIITLDI